RLLEGSTWESRCRPGEHGPPFLGSNEPGDSNVEYRVSSDSPLFSTKPLRVTGVVNLAGPGNLESFLALQNLVCGDPVISSLMGGVPADVPDRYRDASPANLLPVGVKQFLIVGAQDKTVPPHFMKEYEKEATRMGDDVDLTVVENAAHFEVIAPG